MCLGEGREGCCGQRSWQRIKGRQDLFWIVAQRTVDKCFGIVAKNELILQGGEERQKTAQEEEELVGRTVLKVRATRIIANRAKDIVPES